MIDFRNFSQDGLVTTRKRLLNNEPPGHISLLACQGGPHCPVCQEWNRWALELRAVNWEIQQRQQTLTYKKA